MADVICAGHICLDIIPHLDRPFEAAPGALVEIGPATVSTGGCVANAGLALNRLGVAVALCGRVGDDAFGHLAADIVRREGIQSPVRLSAGAQTSYTVVVNPPETDRSFLHFPGANVDFGSDDVPDELLAGAKVLHVGYPPLLKRTMRDDGKELATLFGRAKARGVLTSLDMTMPDTQGESGSVDWQSWLANVLPHCDLFLPSAPELNFMLVRDGGAPLSQNAGTCLQLGAKVVMIKDGVNGLHVQTAPVGNHPHVPASWWNVEHFEPTFKVDVAGTTGAGDATVAGFIAALLQGASAPEAARLAAAVGACSVERPDAISGIPSWAELHDRLSKPWPKNSDET